MRFRMSMCVLAGVVVGLAFSSPARADEQRPNVIVFMIDDLGWTDAGCCGSDLYQTPHIDKLAAEGVRFTDAYAACTVCSPTRAAMMTGMYPARLHLTDWIDGHFPRIKPEQKRTLPHMPPDWTQHLEHRYTTIAEALKKNGYQTAHVGKWHLTPRSSERSVVEPYYPENQGFDFNVAGNQWGAPGTYYWPYRHRRFEGVDARVENFPPEEETKGQYLTDMLTDRAVSLVEEMKDGPFFLHFAHYAVHTPIQGRKDLTEKYQSLITEEHQHHDPGYAAMVESVDHSVGRIREKLDELGLADNTIVIYTSDNGGLDRGDSGSPTDNAPLRDGKGSVYEGGVRIPTIISWPGVSPEGVTCREPIITCDFYPTILEMTGTAGDETHNADVDGLSLASLLKQPNSSLERDTLFWHYPHYHTSGATPYSAIRADHWRLIEFYDDGHHELYNLKDDLSETTDLSKSHPEHKARLLSLLNEWREKVGAQPPLKNLDYRPETEDDTAKFRPLFNGQDLTGWVPVNTAPSTWSVNDNMLVCSGKPIGELRTDRMYQNFILELEWRHMVPKGNAGVFVWADDITARGVPFHRGIEVQVLENAYGNTRSHTTHGDIFPIHGASMVPFNGRGGSRAFPTEERSKPSPEWNHYQITCEDGMISLAVNGKVVTRGKECNPCKGYICLESEGGIVHYRNIRIRELPDSPIEDERVAIADRGYRCLYTGVDLSGWTVADAAADDWIVNDWILSYTGEHDDQAGSLTTIKSFGDAGFIVDFRLKGDSGKPRIQFRGAESTEITIDADAPRIKQHLEPIGKWNRIEARIAADRLTLDLNGQRVVDKSLTNNALTEGPLVILPDGPIDIANPYVRQLDP